MYRNVISMAAIATLAAAMTGCAMESIYTFDLHIENKLHSPIFYCGHYEPPECNNKIEGGEIKRLPYISHVKSDIERPEAFDDVQIKFCGKTTGLERIRLLSPVVKYDENQYRITIDEGTCRKLSQKEN